MKAGEVKVERTFTPMSDGSFTDTYKPDAGGSWSVTARWEGNEQYEGTTSSPANFECVDKGCVIATSTYGSELTPEVQFLRSFRESTVYSTFAGSSFMAVFNQFYYSWSPTVAGQIWGNEALQGVGRVLISPLLGILHVSTMVNSVFSFNPELAIVLTGLVAGSLVGAVYFLPITVGTLYAVKRGRKSLPKVDKLAVLLMPWSMSLMLIYLGETMVSTVLMMAATGVFIICTIAIVTGVIALKILRHF
jgi:peptide/nickel transport system substrate-binding protein